MERTTEERAAEVRRFNRYYTNILGLLNQTILESPYSLAEGRVLLEIYGAGQCTAKELTGLLKIDAGYLSRMLARFIKEKLVAKTRSATDGRAHVLTLTEKGRETFGKLSQASNREIVRLLEALPEYDQMRLVGYMDGIQSILSHDRQSVVTIRGQQPGDIGYIAYRHGVLYDQEYGLAGTFERYVLAGLLKYVEGRQSGHIWVAELDGRIAGFIGLVAIDENTAQLRWFLIEPEYRGLGLGRRLLEETMDYCRQRNYKTVFLWTFRGLDAARHLYQAFGFVPTEEAANDTWKADLVEEKWEMTITG
jgi:DNA-binding MarR family transcriptional regulator/GNAT superfamily N-acetyltransferase